MSPQLASVPTSVPRHRVLEALRILGLDPGDLAALQFYPNGIVVDLYADADEPGRRYALTATHAGHPWNGRREDRVAMHQICIRITDEPAEPAQQRTSPTREE